MTTENLSPENEIAKKVTAQNAEAEPAALPPQSSNRDSNVEAEYMPMEGAGFSNLLSQLLKKPLSLIYEMKFASSDQPIICPLLIISFVCLGVFGFVLGMFDGGQQLWATPVKLIGGITFSVLICFPSLYIFGCLGGMDARIGDIAAIMTTFIATTALLLVGFAPILWLFSTSSNSVTFFGMIGTVIWLISLFMGLRIVIRASKSLGSRKSFHIRVWVCIFTLVTLQMSTSIRPLINNSGDFLDTKEKSFFLNHWITSAVAREASEEEL